jgi:hypothetical protein
MKSPRRPDHIEYWQDSDGKYTARCPCCRAVIVKGVETFSSLVYPGFMHKCKDSETADSEKQAGQT